MIFCYHCTPPPVLPSSTNWVGTIADWATIVGLPFTLLGVILAFYFYYKQRWDDEKDAYSEFQAGLKELKKAVDKSIPAIGQFKDAIATPTDSFANPVLPLSLTDRFLDKIDLAALKRYYEKNDKANYQNLLSFLTKSNFLNKYLDIFINELNYFRSNFFAFERKFQEHRILSSNLLQDVVRGDYQPRNDEFRDRYVAAVNAMHENGRAVLKTVEDGKIRYAVVSRSVLNDEFVLPLAEMSGNYAAVDIKANEVNRIANEVNAARVDMDSLKDNMAKVLAKHIESLEEVQTAIDKLLPAQV